MHINDILKTNTGNGDLIFNDKHRAIKNHKLMQLAKWATFGLYIVAVFMLYVADVWGIGGFISRNSSDFVAMIVFSVIAFTLAFFLASSKEAVYEDIAIHRAEGYKLKTSQIIAMGLFLTSGLLFEAFSTSNNQQHIANSAAEGSEMFKSVVASGVSLSSGSAALTKDLQAAQMRLADCQVRMEKAIATGKKFDCAQSEANLEAVRESMAMSNQLAQQTNADALTAKTDSMLKVREHFDKPMFQAISKATNTDNNTGMMIVIGVLIFVFECQHIMALFAYANALRRIKSKGGDNAEDKPRPTQDAYNITPPLSAFDSAKMSVADERHHLYCTLANGRQMDKVFKAHEADAALKEWQRLNETGIGEDGNPIARLGLHQTYFETEKDAEAFEKKIEADNLKWQSDAPVIKSVTGFKQSADQAANVSRLYQAETAKHEAGKVFADESPTPPIQRQSVTETIHALVDAVKKSGATTDADIQAAVFDGYSKLFNPAELDDKDLMKVTAKIAASNKPLPDTLQTSDLLAKLPVPDTRSDARPGHPSEPQKPRPDAGSDASTAAAQIANPANFELLKRYVSHPKFGEAFVGVATGAIGCSQKQMMKTCSIGGDMPYWIMMILEAWDIVTEPKATENGKRSLKVTLTAEQAETELDSVRETIGVNS